MWRCRCVRCRCRRGVVGVNDEFREGALVDLVGELLLELHGADVFAGEEENESTEEFTFRTLPGLQNTRSTKILESTFVRR